MLDKKELSLTLDDFRTIIHLPHANENNHNSFMPPPSFSDMVPFYKQQLGFTMELKTSSSFKTTGLLQPWQTLCKIFSKCLTTRVTGWDQPPLQIMQMMYCFVNNIHVDYAELLWEGIYYSLHHPTSSIPYPRFTKIIISHYMTSFPEISRRARDMYHNLQDDDIMKNIFNSGRHKDKVGMQIPDWMITEEMKHTEHYRMYAEVFGLDVPLTQSQPTESTQGTHRTPSAPRSPTPKMDTAESSAPKRSTVIHFRLPERRSIRLTPPAPVQTVDKADEMILQDTLQGAGRLSRSSGAQHSHTIRSPRSNGRIITTMVDTHIKEQVKNPVSEQVRDQVPVYVAEGLSRRDIAIWLALQMKFERLQVPQTTCRTLPFRPRDQDDPHDDAHPEGENSAKAGSNQEQVDDYDFWTDSYASDDDEIPTKQVSQDIMEEVSLTIDEAKLRQWMMRCVETKIDPEAPALSLINQDLLYLKKVSSGPKRIVLSLHKFPAIIFNDDDIKEQTSRWVNKVVKKFNLYARYGVKHWKILMRRIFNIKKQKRAWKTKEEASSVLWERALHDFQLGIESYQQKVNLTAPTISFPGVEKHKMFSIIYEPVHGIIYKNSKKEKKGDATSGRFISVVLQHN
ncbi:hypothetical protein Tco_1343153 [Tanacetum coccineum]